MDEDAKFLKRKVHAGSVDVHPIEKALVVNYETEAIILGELGNPMVGDRKECQKIIRVRNLDEDTDIHELAKKIVEKCSLLSESKIPHVEHLLEYLLCRKDTHEKSAKLGPLTGKLFDPGAFDSTEIDEVANLTDLDEYLELLYEDIPERLRASALILQLARNPDNLEELYQNETLIGALARVMREDWKKSTDLVTNIAYIFFCFSSFSNFHSVILHFKIGALTMTIIEHELKKYDIWIEELERKKRLRNVVGANVLQERTALADSSALGSIEGMDESYETSLTKFKILASKQEQLFRVSFYLLLNISEDLSVEIRMHKKGITGMICRCLNRDNFELIILLVSFLKKLSLFKENKDEMVKHNTINKLHGLLSRAERELIGVVLRLLFNLSFDKTARLEMVSQGYISTLVSLLENEFHRSVALYILYHLSTEDESKKSFARADFLSCFMKLALENPSKPADLLPMALAINIACDHACAQMLGDGRGIRLLMKQALRMRDPLLMKLLRNISMNGRELKMKFLDYLPELVHAVTMGGSKEANSTTVNQQYARDHQSFKVNSFEMESTGGSSLVSESKSKEYQLVGSSKIHTFNDSDNDTEDIRLNYPKQKNEDFLLECLACIANLNLKELDFGKLLTELKLLSWIKQRLKCMSVANNPISIYPMGLHAKSNSFLSAQSEDDVFLEIVRLLGTVCLDASAAKLVYEAGIVELLIELLNAKQEDDELVCQIIHVFYQLVYHEGVRSSVIASTQAPAYLMDLMHDKNNEIRRICDTALDIISDFDSIWANRIQAERFRWHNNQWLQMVESKTEHLSGTLEAYLSTESAPMAGGHARAQHRRALLTDIDVLPDQEDDFENYAGPFGMGLDIDNAADFLSSLSHANGSRKNSADSEQRSVNRFKDEDYMKRIELLYSDMCRGTSYQAGDGHNSPSSVSDKIGSDMED